MSKIAIFMANGFEEIEGLTVVDILRRAGKTIDMISIDNGEMVTGSHGISIKTDLAIKDANFAEYDMLVLPGGQPGTNNLKACKEVTDKIIEFNNAGKYIAAICAAPTVFAGLGLLEGKNACCYESCEPDLTGANVTRDEVTVDGNIITSRGMGTAIAFGLKLVEMFDGEEVAKKLGSSLMYRK